MSTAVAATIVDAFLGWQLGAAGQDGANRFSLEGLAVQSKQEGEWAIQARSFEAASLRLELGPLAVEVGRLSLRQLDGRIGADAGGPQLLALQAATAELSCVKAEGFLPRAPRAGAGTAWTLGPLAAANGTVRAQIVDAHLLFDADVTVPIREGQVDFNDATVEHVGPDSRMGVSRLGLYVDAPNGRSYLYQFPSAPVAGVEYERRGPLPGPWSTDRGKLRLQEFGEAVLREISGGNGVGVTGQARLLLGRTAVQGELRLGDGPLATPGLKADLVGRSEGRNAVTLRAEAVGRGLAIGISSFSARHAQLDAGDFQGRCDAIEGALTLRLSVDGARVRFAIELAGVKLSGLHLERRHADPGSHPPA